MSALAPATPRARAPDDAPDRDAAEARLADRLAALRPLLGRVNDLKRIRTAAVPGRSLAQRRFARAWRDLAAGASPARVAEREAAAALVALELGGIDAASLRRGGLDDARIHAVLGAALAKAGAPATAATRARLQAALPALLQEADDAVDVPGAAAVADAAPQPAFVRALQDQPRAGATHPTEPRLMLEPPESHADHCWAVAAIASLLAVETRADPGPPLLAALAHHLHNAVLPDGGFAGEALLGDALAPLVERLADAALDTLAPAVAQRAREALALLPAPDSPEAMAFHAADVVDRVAEAAHFDRVACYRLAHALDTLGLVHPGPLKAFQDRVLAASGLVAP